MNALAAEGWTWPPNYDESYLPQPSDQYWFPQRETMPPGDREPLLVERIRQLMEYAFER